MRNRALKKTEENLDSQRCWSDDCHFDVARFHSSSEREVLIFDFSFSKLDGWNKTYTLSLLIDNCHYHLLQTLQGLYLSANTISNGLRTLLNRQDRRIVFCPLPRGEESSKQEVPICVLAWLSVCPQDQKNIEIDFFSGSSISTCFPTRWTRI